MSFDGEKGMSWGQEGCGNDKLLQEEKAGPGLSVEAKGRSPTGEMRRQSELFTGGGSGLI